MRHEYEIINHSNIQNFKVFLVSLQYREPHLHKDLELCFILDGTVNCHSYKQQLTLEKNDFVLLNSCQPHEIFSSDKQPALILAIQIPPSFCKEYFPDILNLNFSFCSGNQYLSTEQKSIFFCLLIHLAFVYFQKTPGFEFQCIGLLNLLFSLLVSLLPWDITTEQKRQKKSAINMRIQNLIQYIEEHYTEKLLLSDLAQQEGLTVSYLSHFFKEHFQVSFQSYLASLRCEKARYLLLMTEHSLLDICMESGFSDIKYMTAAFRQKYGCTPKEYRQQFWEADLPKQQKTLLSTQNFFSDSSSLILLDPYKQQAFNYLTTCPASIFFNEI